jgi:hypothetical protein
MVSYAELLGQVKQLTPEERLALIEATAQMVKEDLRLQASKVELESASVESLSNKNTNPHKYVPFIREDLLHLDEKTFTAEGFELRGSSVDNILGIGWLTQNGLPPNDEKNKEEYINYLIEKYS